MFRGVTKHYHMIMHTLIQLNTDGSGQNGQAEDSEGSSTNQWVTYYIH